MAQFSVSVVIPTLNASRHLPALIQSLHRQKPLAPVEIVLVDSNSTDDTRAVAGQFVGVKVVQVGKFSHGRARNLGVSEAVGDIIVLMTQDAIPAGESWLSELLAPLDDQAVGAVYSRQVPRDDANPMERFFLLHRFPEGQEVRRVCIPGKPLMLEDVFFSNVSSAVRRSLLLKHPFDEQLIMSEDQQFSRDIIRAGWAVVYRPSSKVIHSHNYTLKSVVKRYFDSVYSLSKVFPEHGVATSSSMGARYVYRELGYITRQYPLWIPYWCLYTSAKAIGTLAGHAAEYMPYWILRRVSLHAYHWERER
ncbi:MAG: glycosyltransferase [bacterium]